MKQPLIGIVPLADEVRASYWMLPHCGSWPIPAMAFLLTAGSPLWTLLGKDALAVNSLHHQAIKTLAPGLAAMAVSEDGLTEAVCLPDKRFVWVVQWPPEFSFRVNEDSRKIFKAFVGAC